MGMVRRFKPSVCNVRKKVQGLNLTQPHPLYCGIAENFCVTMRTFILRGTFKVSLSR